MSGEGAATGGAAKDGFRALSLDLFDTLVDLRWESGPGRTTSTPRLHREVTFALDIELDAFRALLEDIDRELRSPRFAEGLELPTTERFTHLACRLGLEDPALPERLTEIHMEVIRGMVVVPEHHSALLGSLRQRVRVGLCSNFSHAPTARRILDEAGLSPHFDAVAISEEVGLRKPRREIFEAVLDGLSAAPGETLHVGDRLRADVGGAAALGMRTAWITRCVPDPDRMLAEYDGPRPDWIISDLDQLGDLL